MEAPANPENEKERIEALKNSQLLGSAKEAVFDNLTALISQSFKVPVVAISLVDEARQWFKSIQGLNICETSREVSFCGHVVYQSKPLVVPNAREDKRFYDNPLVKESPNIAFYAGVPLRYAYQGKVYLIGTICLIDYVPRSFTDDELEMLKSFAFQLESLIEMRLPSQKFEELTKKLSEDAIEIQDLENNIRYLQTISETDVLTNIPNRRYLDRLIKQTWFDDLSNKSICLMMLDIDGFKKINDVKGEHVGDNILKSIAVALNKLFKVGEDHICRLRSDEFVLVIYNHDVSGIDAHANKILDYFTGQHTSADLKGVTISIGAYITSDKSQSLKTLLKAAEGQLRKAKKAGKNKFVCNQ